MKETEIRIGIVDDHEDIRFTLAQICEFQGWKTYCASNYKEAISMVKKVAFDIIIVDYHLPEVDGVEIVREAHLIQPKAAILVLTVEESEGVAKRFIEAGANDYALKPIRAVDLVSRIQVHLKYKCVSQANSNVVKGINDGSLNRIIVVMKEKKDYMDAEELAAETGMSVKSIYRYIQYLVSKNSLRERSVFNGAIGRPKTEYLYLEE